MNWEIPALAPIGTDAMRANGVRAMERPKKEKDRKAIA
jgi:hypothetical protein